jgi:hypothetical protein
MYTLDDMLKALDDLIGRQVTVKLQGNRVQEMKLTAPAVRVVSVNVENGVRTVRL